MSGVAQPTVGLFSESRAELEALGAPFPSATHSYRPASTLISYQREKLKFKGEQRNEKRSVNLKDISILGRELCESAGRGSLLDPRSKMTGQNAFSSRLWRSVRTSKRPWAVRPVLKRSRRTVTFCCRSSRDNSFANNSNYIRE